MQSVAKARFQRVAPRKVRKVLDLVRGKNVAEALSTLKRLPNSGANIVYKCIDSAVSNAEQKASQKDEKVNFDELAVFRAFADEAPNMHMRRWRPRAQGRATRIVKGMSHVTIILSDETPKKTQRATNISSK